MPHLRAAAVLPARFAAQRLPGKPLLAETGKVLIQHVWEQVKKAKNISRIIIATDDERIFEAVKAFRGEVVMTRADHPSGTDRIAEVAAKLDEPIIVNVQGDEPEVAPESIDQLVELAQTTDAPVSTLACDFSHADPADPAKVKVVRDLAGYALYFSRSLIPFPRGEGAKPLLHVGMYAYKREFLLRFPSLEPTRLEKAEKLEQLRVLEHGFRIAVGLTAPGAGGIDTPEDYRAFVKRYADSHYGGSCASV
ncbi:MAG: 3-deoxy-manno-octulosonate cytidylyltransferase [Planctomycetes bacterium]|nr:3-deoxy-manno-octulosonate cytidylyltransferase [Planctomycetota bacterium]